MNATFDSPTMESLGLHRLSTDARIRLAQELRDSIPNDDKPFELTDEDRQELDRRLADHLANPSTALTREEVQERLKARRSQS